MKVSSDSHNIDRMYGIWSNSEQRTLLCADLMNRSVKRLQLQTNTVNELYRCEWNWSPSNVHQRCRETIHRFYSFVNGNMSKIYASIYLFISYFTYRLIHCKICFIHFKISYRSNNSLRMNIHISNTAYYRFETVFDFCRTLLMDSQY